MADNDQNPELNLEEEDGENNGLLPRCPGTQSFHTTDHYMVLISRNEYQIEQLTLVECLEQGIIFPEEYNEALAKGPRPRQFALD